jgi:hypothetical protein
MRVKQAISIVCISFFKEQDQALLYKRGQALLSKSEPDFFPFPEHFLVIRPDPR